MANIIVHLKDGKKHEFRHVGRGGGSYTKTVRYEGAFVIVSDEWDKEIAFPAADVRKVEAQPHRY